MTTTWERCFIALSPDAETRQRLASLPVETNARRVAAPDLHLTLAFLGRLSQDQSAQLADALPALAAPLPGFDFTGIELWPGPQRARVQVATFTLPGALQELLRHLNPLLIDMGLPVDSRPFRPHVTLARFAHGRQAGADHAAEGSAAFVARFRDISLYARAPAGNSLRYMALARHPL